MSTTFTTEGHAERILQKLWQRRKNQKFSDIVLIAGTEKKRIPAHRSVLREASEYFDEMFKSSQHENISKFVEIPEVNGDALLSLAEYCYKGRVLISENNVVELLKTAHMLHLRDVVTACANFLIENLHPSNCLRYALLADQYHCELLLQKAKEYSLAHFMEICGTADFLQLNVKQLCQLLTCDGHRIVAEEVVFKSLKAWLEHDPFEREPHKVELLKLIRMQLMERTFLIQHVKPICTSMECLRIYMEALEYHPSYDSKSNLANPRTSDQALKGLRVNDHNEFVETNVFNPSCQPSFYSNDMFSNLYGSHPLYASAMPRESNLTFSRTPNQVLMGFPTNSYKPHAETNGLNPMHSNLYTHPLGIIGKNLRKPRTTNQVLMSVAVNSYSKKMCMHYYSPQKNKWLKLLKELEYRTYFGITSIENCLYIIGGFNAERHTLNTVICLNLSSLISTEMSPMTLPRDGCSAAVLNDLLYALGGWNGNDAISSVEKFCPGANKWINVAPMSVNRSNAGVAVLGQKLYVVGGNSKFGKLNSAECYDPVQDVWQTIAPMGKNRQSPGVAVANGLLYAVGGWGTRTAERYDLQTNKWTFIGGLSEELYPYSACTIFNDKIIVSFKNRLEEYDAVANEWKAMNSVRQPNNLWRIFSYSGKLPALQFVET